MSKDLNAKGEGGSHEDPWGKCIPGRRSQCKRLQDGSRLLCSRRARKAVWLVPNEREKESLDTARRVTEDQVR